METMESETPHSWKPILPLTPELPSHIKMLDLREQDRSRPSISVPKSIWQVRCAHCELTERLTGIDYLRRATLARFLAVHVKCKAPHCG